MTSKKLYLLPENLLQEYLKSKNESSSGMPKISDKIFDSDITEKKISQLKSDLVSSLNTDNLDIQSLNVYKNKLSRLLDLKRHNPEKTEIINELERLEQEKGEGEYKKGFYNKDRDSDDEDDDDDDDDRDNDEDYSLDEDNTTRDENLKTDKEQIAREEGEKNKNVSFFPVSSERKSILKTPQKTKQTFETPKKSPRIPRNSLLDHELLKFEKDQTQNAAMKLDLWMSKNPGHKIRKVDNESGKFTIDGKPVKGDINDILIDLARPTKHKELKIQSPGIRAGEDKVLRALAEVGLPESYILNVRRRTVYNSFVTDIKEADVSKDLKRNKPSSSADEYSMSTPKQARNSFLYMFGNFKDSA